MCCRTLAVPIGSWRAERQRLSGLRPQPSKPVSSRSHRPEELPEPAAPRRGRRTRPYLSQWRSLWGTARGCPTLSEVSARRWVISRTTSISTASGSAAIGARSSQSGRGVSGPSTEHCHHMAERQQFGDVRGCRTRQQREPPTRGRFKC